MNAKLVVLIGLLAIGACQSQYLHNDWFAGLFDNINRMTANIHGNVHQLQLQIERDIQRQLAHVDAVTADIHKNIDNVKTNSTFIRNGNTIIINGSGGASRSIYSGITDDGTPYYRDREDKIVGNVLYRTDRVYNRTTDKVQEYKYTLDLTNPNAKLEPVKDKK